MGNIQKVLVTPELAKYWLKKNRSNRPIRPTQVHRLAQLIRDGKWVLTPDAVGFDVNDNLTNAQHRLAAVVQSGIAVEMFLCTDLPVESFSATDQGCTRSVSDAIREDKHLVAVANFILKFVWQTRAKPANHIVKLFCAQIKPQYERLMETVTVLHSRNGSSRGYCRTQVIAAGVVALLEAGFGTSGITEEYILSRMASWFNGNEPARVTLSMISFLSERRNRVDLEHVFLKSFHLFDPASQDFSRLYCRNEAIVRERIVEMLDIPQSITNKWEGRFQIDPLTGEGVAPKKQRKNAG